LNKHDPTGKEKGEGHCWGREKGTTPPRQLNESKGKKGKTFDTKEEKGFNIPERKGSASKSRKKGKRGGRTDCFFLEGPPSYHEKASGDSGGERERKRKNPVRG